MEYPVRFGSGWGRDGIGLMGQGKILTNHDSISLYGRQHTSILFKVLLWLISAIMVANVLIVLSSRLISVSSGGFHDPRVIALWLVGFILAVVVATLLTKYFGSSPYSRKISKASIVEVRRVGRQLRLKAAHDKKSLMFKVSFETEAEKIALEFVKDSGVDPLQND
ncbi:MAG: hypothetical protein ACP5U1_08190 [Desulfomonilaceae bacterium]